MFHAKEECDPELPNGTDQKTRAPGATTPKAR